MWVVVCKKNDTYEVGLNRDREWNLFEIVDIAYWYIINSSLIITIHHLSREVLLCFAVERLYISTILNEKIAPTQPH